jgi:hypothetical protein
MAEHDPYDTRTTRRRGDTEPTNRLDEGAPAYGDPVNPDWRGSRVTRRNRRSQGFPSSRQEFVLWLQFGGWRVLLAAVVLVGVTVWLIWLTSRPSGTSSPFAQPTEDLASSGAGVSTLPLQETVTPRPTIAAPTAGAGTTADGAQFRVFNTEGQGLFLRQDHSADSQVLKTLPDGTVVTVIGPDFSGPDRVWKNVRDPDGSTGWVASDFLQAVQ